MAKKMTCKEFKQVLEQAGVEVEWEAILNSISGWYRECGQDMTNAHCEAGAKRFYEISNSIYNALDSRGYYNDTKVI